MELGNQQMGESDLIIYFFHKYSFLFEVTHSIEFPSPFKLIMWFFS